MTVGLLLLLQHEKKSGSSRCCCICASRTRCALQLLRLLQEVSLLPCPASSLCSSSVCCCFHAGQLCGCCRFDSFAATLAFAAMPGLLSVYRRYWQCCWLPFASSPAHFWFGRRLSSFDLHLRTRTRRKAVYIYVYEHIRRQKTQ